MMKSSRPLGFHRQFHGLLVYFILLIISIPVALLTGEGEIVLFPIIVIGWISGRVVLSYLREKMEKRRRTKPTRHIR